MTRRCDSGFSSQFVVQACRDHEVRYSITVPHNPAVKRAIKQITEEGWTGIDDTANGEAWVAETSYVDHRLIVRRTKLSDPSRPADGQTAGPRKITIEPEGFTSNSPTASPARWIRVKGYLAVRAGHGFL